MLPVYACPSSMMGSFPGLWGREEGTTGLGHQTDHGTSYWGRRPSFWTMPRGLQELAPVAPIQPRRSKPALGLQVSGSRVAAPWGLYPNGGLMGAPGQWSRGSKEQRRQVWELVSGFGSVDMGPPRLAGYSETNSSKRGIRDCLFKSLQSGWAKILVISSPGKQVTRETQTWEAQSKAHKICSVA